VPLNSVVVHDLHISCAILGPAKNDTPLGINTNAIKTLELTSQWLEPVARRGTKIIEALRSIQNIELVEREFMYLAWKLSGIATRYTVKEVRSAPVAADVII
jgi:hypothetical protein